MTRRSKERQRISGTAMIEYQSFLARLYTDDVFRRLNRISPAAAESFFRLNHVETACLRRLDLDEIDAFAGSLAARSREQLRGLLPASVRALGDAAADRACDRFRSLHRSAPGERPIDLLRGFGRFLEESLRADDSQPEWLPELVRCEVALRECGLQGARSPATSHALAAPGDGVFRLADGVRVAAYAFDVLPWLDKPEPPAREPARGVTHALMIPQAGSRHPKVMKLNLLAARLLGSFGHGKSREAVAHALEGVAAAPDLAHAIRSAVQRFAMAGALVAVQ